MVSLSSNQDQAVLRLAWTARPERIEECRQQSEEELAKLPAHMRQSMACIGTTATYRLEVRWNDRVVLQQSVRGGGLRHDRPLYLFHDINVAPGDAAVRVQLDRVESIRSIARGRNEAIPPSLLLERRLHLESRKVVLVTYDAERRDLVVVQDAGR
jgi:hypothetical protein